MQLSLERLWVSWLNSDRWRQFAKWGPGALFFRSAAFKRLDLARRNALTAYQNWADPTTFQDVKTFCFFVGHTKSGCSLLGALLDAHPDVVLADEADALRYVRNGFTREQIYRILLKTARREAMKGRVTARRLTPYSLRVPGQWQGRYRTLRVIGDSKAGPSTRQLGRDLSLLQRVEETMGGVDVQILHVVRNPFDPISVMMVRGERSFENAVDHYFDYCDTLVQVRARVRADQLLTVPYEEFLSAPSMCLRGLCHFLGLRVSSDYVDACLGILRDKPDRSRDLVEWTPERIAVVQRRMEPYEFLNRYRYEE